MGGRFPRCRDRRRGFRAAAIGGGFRAAALPAAGFRGGTLAVNRFRGGFHPRIPASQISGRVAVGSGYGLYGPYGYYNDYMITAMTIPITMATAAATSFGGVCLRRMAGAFGPFRCAADLGRPVARREQNRPSQLRELVLDLIRDLRGSDAESVEHFEGGLQRDERRGPGVYRIEAVVRLRSLVRRLHLHQGC